MDIHVAASIADQAAALETTGGFVDRFAADADHVGENLLRDHKFIHLHTILRHQQPAGEARIGRVKAVADGGARQL